MDDESKRMHVDSLNVQVSNHQSLKDSLPVIEHAGSSGKGFPYAPEDFPSPGDVWTWRVGKRYTRAGFWQDRSVHPPDRLQSSTGNKKSFIGRPSLEQYIRNTFPDADVDAFFASFIWKIPCTNAAKDASLKIIKSSGCLKSAPAVQHGCCKANNVKCSIKAKKNSSSLSPASCNICCSEPNFCRYCCCILCSKTIDWIYDGYSFIKCEVVVDEKYICGHVSHIECALRACLAGKVGGSIDLDTQYYCRCCDNKTDLLFHVEKIIKVSESIDNRDDMGKVLNLGYCILRGSEKERTEKLRNHIATSIEKLKHGVSSEDIWKKRSETSELGLVLQETMSQNPSSSHSSSLKPEKVDLNIFGVPVSKNAGKIATRIGKLVRAHVPISYSSWDKVPETYKDDVWTELMKIYELDPLSKEHFFKKMSESFRRHKSDLRASYYDTFNNDEERMKNCPPTIAQEDWDEFLKNEATPGGSKRRQKGKKNRSMLGYGHHTGRKSHAIIEQEMLVASPSTKIKRHQVWEKTHTKKDGSIADVSSSYFDQIAKAKETINDSDEDKLSLDEDILSQVFSKDAKGRSRIIGTKIPSSQVKACAIARKRLIQAHGDNDEVKTRLGNLEGKMELLIGMVQGNAEQGNRAPDNASYGGSGTQFVAPQFMNSTNVVINQKCEILNLDQETIATGIVCRDSTSSNIHGKSIPSTHEKLVLDNILLPDERTTKINHQFAETFGDVGVGGYVCHPKTNIRYL